MVELGAVESPEGEVLLFDGIALIMRGDLMTILYPADAGIHRNRWIFGHAEQLMTRCPKGIVGMTIIPQSSKPPDQATRDSEQQFYERLGNNVRRLVTVPEGNPIFVSIVRLVITAYIRLQGKGAFFFFAKGVDDGIRLLLEAKSDLTPSPSQIRSDIARLRAALAPHAKA